MEKNYHQLSSFSKEGTQVVILRKDHNYPFVLILAGIERIFLTVASMGLCFGHVLKTMY